MRRSFYITLAIVVVIVTYCGPLMGQETSYDRYMDDVQRNALIFRGRSDRHYNFKYTGTYYAYQEEFCVGNLHFNGKLYSSILINLNAHSDQINVKGDRDHLPVVPDKALVNWFTMADRHYVNIREDECIGLEAGYYEVLVDGDVRLLKKVYKQYKEQPKGAGKYSYIEREFQPVVRYYVERKGRFHQVYGTSTFGKVFKDEKKRINEIIKATPMSVRSNEEFLYKIIVEGLR